MSENNTHVFLRFYSAAGDDDNSISCKLAMPKAFWEEWKKEFRQVMDETTVPKEIEHYWALEHHYGDVEYRYNSVEEFLDCFRETEISETEFNVLVNLLDSTDFKETLIVQEGNSVPFLSSFDSLQEQRENLDKKALNRTKRWGRS
jgi:hypothetical protein